MSGKHSGGYTSDRVVRRHTGDVKRRGEERWFSLQNIAAELVGNLEGALCSVGALLEYEAISFVTIETAKCQLFLELCSKIPAAMLVISYV